MNIRAKERGKAVLFTGDNYEELIDGLGIADVLNSVFRTSSRNTLLRHYREDAISNANRPLIGESSESRQRINQGNYAVITNLGIFELTQTDFNELFEEDTTV